MRGLLMMAQSSLTENLCGQCRICMDIKLNQISVFKNDLSLKIEQIADVEVAPDDGLPTSICLDCEVLLNKCYELRERVIFADNTFREGISFSKVVIEEYIVKEETSASCANDEAMEDGIYDSSFDHENDNHVEVMDVIERTDRTAMLNDPLSLEEPLIEARGGSNSAIDPLACMKVEPVGMDCDSGAGPSTSTAVKGTKTPNHLKITTKNDIRKKKMEQTITCDRPAIKDKLNINEQSELLVPSCSSFSKLFLALNAGKNLNQCELSNEDCPITFGTRPLEVKRSYCSSRDTKSSILLKRSTKNSNKNDKKRTKSSEVCWTMQWNDLETSPESSQPSSSSSERNKNLKLVDLSFCSVCNVSCGSMELLQEHKEGSGFICRVCLYSFETHAEIETHFTTHPSINCKMCGELFFRRRDLFKHRRVSERCKNIVQCDICGKTIVKTSLKAHRYIFHSDNTTDKFRCIVCGKIFSKEYLLTAHLKNTHIVHEYLECKICRKLLMGPERLKNHMKGVHIDPAQDCEMFPCPVCGKEFKYIYLLKRHEEGHDKSVCLCEICGKSVVGKVSLKTHVESEHPKVGSFTCPLCNENFEVEIEMKRHRKRHSKRADPVPTFCEVCGKKYASTAVLKQHLRTHSEERPFRCNICGATFRQMTALRTHGRVHNSVGKYVCNYCGKPFKWKQTYDKHISKCK